MVIGDRKKFLSVLVSLRSDVGTLYTNHQDSVLIRLWYYVTYLSSVFHAHPWLTELRYSVLIHIGFFVLTHLRYCLLTLNHNSVLTHVI